jgi:exonuclease SbcC
MKLKSESIKNKSIIENNEQLINEFKEKINYELLNLDLNALNNNINIENINKEKYKVAVKNIDILDSKRINIEKNIEANNKLLTSKQGEISLLNQQIENYTNLINEANIKIKYFCNGNDLKLIKLNKENEIKELNHSINNINNDIHRINNQYQNSKINLEKLSKSILDYENRINISNDDINLFMVKNNINIEIYNLYLSKVSDINIINKIITDYDIEYTKIKSLILLNEEKLKGYELVDLSLLETKLKELEENSLIIKHEYDISFESYNVISNDYKNLISLNSSNKETIKKYELINELFRLSNGTYSKISKINLQKYVLGIILDKIIIYANHYLKSFASSRYQLKRINDETSSNRGLDLAIIDAQTGQERSVGSLSGGESFLCALALAIGMSEGISNMSGGIRLENIFIDEGFGSLDNEALDNAIEALMILASSGRMIGIISHVSDIKSRITDVITVEKTKNGSKIIIN